MKKLVFIAPHLSTGGMPQYLYKQIESLVNDYEIYCLEWDNHTGGKLVVQRNKIEQLLGKRLITIGENKNSTIDYINSIKPDIVHLQEVPEYFMPYEVAEQLYSTNREYVIIETSHDSSFDVNNKLHFPDKFLMVSNYQVKEFQKLGIPTELVEYPIEKKIRQKTREQILLELGLDPNIKHVINVGLFTPRKNQAEVIEYAKGLKDYPIQFHFIGNQADNFTHYWQPLMQDFPSNCKWWGERSDVDTFYQMADLFLFTSRGHNTDKETMPLVIREAISWGVPSLIYNLDVYEGYFDKFSNIEYLDTNSLKINCDKILQKCNSMPNIQKEIYIISAYPNTKLKEKYLNDTITKLKTLNKKILLASHYPISSYIIEKVDYYIYDSYNMVDNINHTLESDGPDFWVDNDMFHMESIITNHASALSRMFGIAMDFAKDRGYTYFMIMESDSDYNIDDLKLLDKFKSEMVAQNKEYLFFSPKFSEFAWQGERVYETYCFGGVLDSFLQNFKWPTTFEDWNKLIQENKYHNCMEYLLKQKFKNVSEKSLIKGTLKSELLNSKIDLQTVGECSGVFYNENNAEQPILFLYNHDSLKRTTTYEIHINMLKFTTSLDCNCWMYRVLDFSEGDKITVKINTIRDGELYSEYCTSISKEDLNELKNFKKIKFK